MDTFANAHGEVTLAMKLNVHGEASIWTLCKRMWWS